ncbi:uncharacterized protein FFUJ_09017 [Fusarium fujikuroi IMI 58289]|uniref:Uncharacterized protein n=1 Tax=Gibberella fujikuroi (strain CBS 195.34 / IMI 58289 / NRRL A-6831) TaxID=1279085 RepID=S0E7V9_GIBF5|nr:uncharacterized protein FFUJ_09017 [Fusarium fujikuroi IMI 58289]KLO87979.1 uncharacterized protein LW93_5145 [Fusarium fujikuroi]KLP23450.1 uncharacterized protein LW94_13127 [Fusarium fujikuroi]QGI66676.1 hypothetical protein CEK27_010647 [Fusarium fujikuroi]QGI83914.1 hypothetical protein CEK25_010643 [Fusarium fujikuroi]QGI97564.1 hypothetical protein CEK26_010633 [Fusarium fujikuroi]
MSDNQSNSALQPRVLVDCPDGYVMCTGDKPEVFEAVAARELGPGDWNASFPYKIYKREPESHTTEAESSMNSLVSQLDHVVQKMETLQKEKEEIMDKIRARGGKIRIPKN